MKVDRDAAMISVVAGLKITKLPDGRDVVAGFGVVFETHVQMFESVEEVAASLAPFPLQPVPLPDEEGWQAMRDLPPPAMAKLLRLMKETRVAIAAGQPWPVSAEEDE